LRLQILGLSGPLMCELTFCLILIVKLSIHLAFALNFLQKPTSLRLKKHKQLP